MPPFHPEYLRRELWTLTEAACLLTGVDPGTRSTHMERLKRDLIAVSGTTLIGTSRTEDILTNMLHAAAIGTLPHRGTRTDRMEDCLVQPSDAVAWAIAKGYEDIPVEVKSLAPLNVRHTPRAANYTTPWLTILDAAIAKFFSPRRDPDAKKGEVVDWIEKRAREGGIPCSKNVAEAMFTIIKPSDHDPRRRREK